MLDKTAWGNLIPHQGAMCLIDAVVDFDAVRIHCATGSHARSDNPLRNDGRLHAAHLCEYAAQAMAIHGALLAQRENRTIQPGLLVALRQVALHASEVQMLSGSIDVYAERLLDGGASWQYAFRVEHAGAPLVQGRAAIMASVNAAPEAD